MKNDPEQLQRLGQHFITGYKNSRFEEIKELVKKGGIGGIYLTKRNFRGKNFFEIKKEIELLQKIQKENNRPPLFITTDQEGGLVSRVSPPLTTLPTLSYLVNNCTSDADLETKVKEYATIQSRELSEIGINVNFSPVVDLKKAKGQYNLNLHTRIDLRAISSDKDIVTKVAMTYSKISEKNGVIPTLKHFPGLGEVKQDTHLLTGTLNHDLGFLSDNDWVPFKKISNKTGAFIMLGHVILDKIDNKNLVSCSDKIVNGIIREKWRHDGILITDDLNMGPVAKSRHGIGGTSVKSLNAGVDFLLISYDGEQYYKAIYDLIKAENEGLLNQQRVAASKKRILKASLKFNKSDLKICDN